MHKAFPLSELAPGEAPRLDTAPPIAVFHTKEGEIFAVDSNTMVIESDEAPNLPPALTPQGHV